ncbi:MAG: TetR/AcrR family transcriptional regulator [Oscillospiraceae bacterium]
MRENATKQKIFETSLDLFSKYGYNSVSIRDIALAVKIKPASIYYHFESKSAILQEIYNFYKTNYNSVFSPIVADMPNLVLLPMDAMIEQMLFHTDAEKQVYQNKAFLILSTQASVGDETANNLIQKTIFDEPAKLFKEVFAILEQNKRIKPFDTDLFITLYCGLGHSLQMRTVLQFSVTWEEWVLLVKKMFFNLVEVID